MKIITLAFILLLGSSFLSAQAQTNSTYKIVKKIPLAGNAHWDFLFSDDAAGRLYVSHGDMVQVLDEKSNKLVGTISGMDGVHGIAVDDKLNKGFITNGDDNTVAVFDTKTLKVITRIKVTGKKPDPVLFDPFSNKVFVFNGHSNNSTVIDAATNKIVATIPFVGNPEFCVTNGKGKVYVNLESASKICVINSSTLKVEHVWSIAPGKEPSGLALDNKNHRLFSTCANKMMVIVDATTGKVVTTEPIGVHPDAAAFDPVNKRAYASCIDGTLTVVQEENANSFKVLAKVTTMYGSKTMALNRSTHHVYLSSAEFTKPGPTAKRSKPKIKPGTFAVLDIVSGE